MFGDIIQPTHLIFILVVALLVLGPKRLPEVGRQLGRGMRDFRQGLQGVESEARGLFSDALDEPTSPPDASSMAQPEFSPPQTPAASPHFVISPDPDSEPHLVIEPDTQAQPVIPSATVSAPAPESAAADHTAD